MRIKNYSQDQPYCEKKWLPLEKRYKASINIAITLNYFTIRQYQKNKEKEANKTERWTKKIRNQKSLFHQEAYSGNNSRYLRGKQNKKDNVNIRLHRLREDIEWRTTHFFICLILQSSKTSVRSNTRSSNVGVGFSSRPFFEVCIQSFQQYTWNTLEQEKFLCHEGVIICERSSINLSLPGNWKLVDVFTLPVC